MDRDSRAGGGPYDHDGLMDLSGRWFGGFSGESARTRSYGALAANL